MCHILTLRNQNKTWKRSIVAMNKKGTVVVNTKKRPLPLDTEDEGNNKDDENSASSNSLSASILTICMDTAALCHNTYKEQSKLETEYGNSVVAKIQQLVQEVLRDQEITPAERNENMLHSIWELISTHALYRK